MYIGGRHARRGSVKGPGVRSPAFGVSDIDTRAPIEPPEYAEPAKSCPPGATLFLGECVFSPPPGGCQVGSKWDKRAGRCVAGSNAGNSRMIVVAVAAAVGLGLMIVWQGRKRR